MCKKMHAGNISNPINVSFLCDSSSFGQPTQIIKGAEKNVHIEFNIFPSIKDLQVGKNSCMKSRPCPAAKEILDLLDFFNALPRLGKLRKFGFRLQYTFRVR